MKDPPLSKVYYQLLEPGPVVLLPTSRKGRANIMTMSWHMMVEFEPPQVACVVSNANHSFTALRATKECVLAIPALELASKVVGIGNCSGRDVDKFERFRLTRAPTERVSLTLPGGNGGERRYHLSYSLAAAVWTRHIALFEFRDVENLGELQSRKRYSGLLSSLKETGR